MSICDYSGIAEYYEAWCTGDDSYIPSQSFYLDYLAGYTGIFAELGVGTGRIAIPIARRKNVKVYGIDLCKEMLLQCEKRKPSDADLILIHSDFKDFALPQKADVIYMPFRTIGHIMTRTDMESFFACIRNNIKENGLFIFDHYMFDRKWAESHNGVDILMYEDNYLKISDRYIYDFIKKEMHCTIVANDSEVTRFDFRWIDIDEIKEIYSACGFSCEKLLGDFDGSEWTMDSPNQIWILREK